MNTKAYLMESEFLEQLLADRSELYKIARSFGDAENMRVARDDLMAETPIYVAPKAGNSPDYQIADGVAHIPVVGELTPKAKTDICGAYTAEELTEYGFIEAALQDADQNERVESIQLNVDSPGGYFAGLMPVVAAIRSVGKPTVARVGTVAASAAFWIATQADSIEAESIASRVGSVGVAVEEYDNTEALENAGVKRRVYTATDAPDKRPDTQTEEGRAKIVAQLDDIHQVFVRMVAEGRGTTAKDVTENYGRGGMVMAEQAMKLGMIDSVDSMPNRRIIQDATQLGVAEESQSTAPEAGNREEAAMDKQQLSNEHPDLYAAIKSEGREEESARVARLMKAGESDPDNVKLQALVQATIVSGETYEEISDKVNVAIRDGAKLDGENAPDVQTMGNELAGLDEDDREAIRLMGITPQEYRKLNEKEAE